MFAVPAAEFVPQIAVEVAGSHVNTCEFPVPGAINVVVPVLLCIGIEPFTPPVKLIALVIVPDIPPATTKFPAIPTPPATVNAPVVVDIDVAVLTSCKVPVLKSPYTPTNAPLTSDPFL